MLFRRLIIRFFTPMIWRFFPNVQTQTIQDFSQVEFDSGRQSLKCLLQTKQISIKGFLFQHILEEYKHASMFYALAQARSDIHLTTKILPQRRLLGKNPTEINIVDCFSYIHAGERSVNKDFQIYLNSKMDYKTKNVFQKIAEDECLHESKSYDFLKKMVRDQKLNLIIVIAKAESRKIWYSYTDIMSRIGKFPLKLMLSLIYYLLGWIGLSQLQTRLHLNRDEQFKIFRAQIQDFEKRAMR